VGVEAEEDAGVEGEVPALIARSPSISHFEDQGIRGNKNQGLWVREEELEGWAGLTVTGESLKRTGTRR
jgi:hypothetical protein